MSRVVVIGGGPAGMFAAIAAAENGHHVTLLEKMRNWERSFLSQERDGVILPIQVIWMCSFKVSWPTGSFYTVHFTHMTIRWSLTFLSRLGCRLKWTGKPYFPCFGSFFGCDRSTAACVKKRSGGDPASQWSGHIIIWRFRGRGTKKVCGVRLSDGEKIQADDVIVATGGFSYQTTGSTGDGYRFAKEAGHTVTEIRPSLVPFNAKKTMSGRCRDFL